MKKALNDVKKADFGIDAREPIHLVLKEVDRIIGEARLNRLIFTGELFDFIDKKTTNQEVINARKGKNLLGYYLEELEEQIATVEQLLFNNHYIAPEEPAEKMTSTVTFSIIREES